MLELRAHHLLCSILFQGSGYSEKFVLNMTEVVELLKRPDTEVFLKASPDAVCSACPNALSDGRCALDDNRKDIRDLDHMVLEKMHLDSGCGYHSSELIMRLKEGMTSSFFESCCNACRWYRQGFCSYEAYMSGLDRFLNT